MPITGTPITRQFLANLAKALPSAYQGFADFIDKPGALNEFQGKPTSQPGSHAPEFVRSAISMGRPPTVNEIKSMGEMLLEASMMTPEERSAAASSGIKGVVDFITSGDFESAIQAFAESPELQATVGGAVLGMAIPGPTGPKAIKVADELKKLPPHLRYWASLAKRLDGPEQLMQEASATSDRLVQRMARAKKALKSGDPTDNYTNPSGWQKIVGDGSNTWRKQIGTLHEFLGHPGIRRHFGLQLDQPVYAYVTDGHMASSQAFMWDLRTRGIHLNLSITDNLEGINAQANLTNSLLHETIHFQRLRKGRPNARVETRPASRVERLTHMDSTEELANRVGGKEFSKAAKQAAYLEHREITTPIPYEARAHEKSAFQGAAALSPFELPFVQTEANLLPFIDLPKEKFDKIPKFVPAETSAYELFLLANSGPGVSAKNQSYVRRALASARRTRDEKRFSVSKTNPDRYPGYEARIINAAEGNQKSYDSVWGSYMQHLFGPEEAERMMRRLPPEVQKRLEDLGYLKAIDDPEDISRMKSFVGQEPEPLPKRFLEVNDQAKMHLPDEVPTGQTIKDPATGQTYIRTQAGQWENIATTGKQPAKTEAGAKVYRNLSDDGELNKAATTIFDGSRNRPDDVLTGIQRMAPDSEHAERWTATLINRHMIQNTASAEEAAWFNRWAIRTSPKR